MKKILMFLCCVFALSTTYAAENCEYISDLSSVSADDIAKLSVIDGGGYVCRANVGRSRECPGLTEMVLGDGRYMICNGDVWPTKYKWNDASNQVKGCALQEIEKWGDIIKHGDYLLLESAWEHQGRGVYLATSHASTVYRICKIDTDLVREYVSCKQAQKRGETAVWSKNTCGCTSKDNVYYTWKDGKCVEDNRPISELPDEGPCNDSAYNKNCIVLGSNGSICAKTGAEKNYHTCTPVINKYPLDSMEHKISGNNCSVKCRIDGWDTTLMNNACEQNYKPNTNRKKCVTKSQKPGDNNGGGIGGGKPPAGGSGKPPVAQQPGDGNNDAGTGGNNGDTGGDVNVVVNPPFNCSLDMFADWRVLYKDCADVLKSLDELELYCVSSEKIEQGYKTRVAKLQELRAACEQRIANQKSRVSQSTTIITGASKSLDDIMGTLKVDVWKTAEGNFNGARLASDSIAGVVLGTAGGLITSHLVKKGQIKNGFEDIQCTVGGQKVADWGDEFTVGIR